MSGTAPLPIARRDSRSSRAASTSAGTSLSHSYQTKVEQDLEFDIMHMGDSGRISGVLSPPSYTSSFARHSRTAALDIVAKNSSHVDAPMESDGQVPPLAPGDMLPPHVDEAELFECDMDRDFLLQQHANEESGEAVLFASESDSDDETISGDEVLVQALRRRHSKSLRLALEHELDVARDETKGGKIRGGTYKHGVAARMRHIGFKA